MTLRALTILSFAAGIGLLASLASAQSTGEDERVILADAVLMPDGTLADDTAVVIRDGRIDRVESAGRYDDADGDHIIRRPGATLSPGLIDVRSTLGVVGHNFEHTHPIDPGLRVIEALDRRSRHFEPTMQRGVTAVMLLPGENNLVGGSAAVVRTWSESGRPQVVREDGPMIFSLGPPTLRNGRAPTARSGALAMLRDALTKANDGEGDQRLSAVLSGDRDFIVLAHGGEDVSAAYRLFDSYGIGAVVAHSRDLLEVAQDIVYAEMPVIAGPYDHNTPVEQLVAPARLSEQGVEICFAGGTPQRSADSLRLTAGLAVRYGMDPAAARRAMTINAARAAGVDDTLGRIAEGAAADLVVFSADPLAFDARTLEVYIEGDRVHTVERMERYIADDESGYGDDLDDAETGERDDDADA